MAIHGPRNQGSIKEKTFYDTLNDKQKENWKKVLELTLFEMGVMPMLDFMPEDLIKKAINGLHRRIMNNDE